jgi:hypothetical protein
MNWLYSAFWGCLAASALVTMMHDGPGRAGGLLVVVWAGGNSFLWARKGTP